jgi:RNA-splicing ligase RtcB
MSNKPLHIGEEAAVQMPMKTVVSLIVIVALGTMGYFQIVERLNIADTRLQLMEKDLTENTDFRIKWPRGQLGSLPADSEQFMLIEDLYKQVEKLQENIEMNMSNKLRIEFMEGQINKLLTDVEKLKDENREIVYKNGNGQ